MKWLTLALIVTVAFAVSARAAGKITCEGILSTVVAANISRPKISQHVGLVLTSLMQR